MKCHCHSFDLKTEYSGIHRHSIKGIVKKQIGIGAIHFHFYFGVSSYLDHTHYFSGATGGPVPTENGHIHKIKGKLETSGSHNHDYVGFTSEQIYKIKSTTTPPEFLRKDDLGENPCCQNTQALLWQTYSQH